MHSLGTEVCVVRGRPSGGDEALGSWDTRTNLACGAKGGVPPLGGAAGQYLLKLALLPPSTSVSAWGGGGGGGFRGAQGRGGGGAHWHRADTP